MSYMYFQVCSGLFLVVIFYLVLGFAGRGYIAAYENDLIAYEEAKYFWIV
jgi:hypothetical protein